MPPDPTVVATGVTTGATTEANTAPAATAPRSGRRPDRLAAAALVAALAVTTAVGVRPVSDPSPWLHLKIGAYLLDGGRFGLPDPWAPFATKPFVLTEWLPAVVGELVHGAFGLPGLAWLRCAGMLALLLGLLWATRYVAGGVTAVVAALAALAGSYEGLTERPQLVGFVFLALAVGAWWRTASDHRPRWWLVPLTWVWACCHGSWVIGVGLGLVVLATTARHPAARGALGRLAAVPVLCVLAAALTPAGPGLLLTPFTVGGNARQFVGEWQPTSIRDPYAVVTLVMLAVVGLSWARSRVAPPLWQVALAGCALAATLTMTRTIAVGAIVAAPLLAQELERHRPSASPVLAARLPAWRTVVPFVAAALALAAPLAAVRASLPTGLPLSLDRRLDAIPAGSVVLAEGDLSGWLFWAHPQVRPTLDPRIEIYSPAYVHSFIETMAAGPAWRGFLSRTDARYALVHEGSPIAVALADRAGWRAQGDDAGFVLLESP